MTEIVRWARRWHWVREQPFRLLGERPSEAAMRLSHRVTACGLKVPFVGVEERSDVVPDCLNCLWTATGS